MYCFYSGSFYGSFCVLTNIYLFLQNDRLHFRQPLVMTIQEEVERLKERYHEQAKLLRECQALKVSDE